MNRRQEEEPLAARDKHAPRGASGNRALSAKAAAQNPPVKRRAPLGGTAVVWAQGVQARYGISAPTRWRWEKSGRLPPPDVNLGGKTGWRHSTIEAAETV